jgi:hypothetical protein
VTGLDDTIVVEDEFQDRMRSAMVLYSLERELGRFVRTRRDELEALGSTVASGVAVREADSGRMVDAGDADAIIGASYLDELMALAKAVAPDGAESEAANRIHALYLALQIFDARNAIAHPNRPFPVNYWHRVAALGTDSAIHVLRLDGVHNAYRAAVEGRIDVPPDEWLAAPTWVLPNNLPGRLEHDLTGLIGRRNELAETRRLIENPRTLLLAVVGQGGLGKTALVLESLRALVADPRSSDFLDRVLYVSAKTEELTHEGLREVEGNPSTLDAVRDAIAIELGHNGDFATAVAREAEVRLLLVIDNLETLLRDSPTTFAHFYQGLPPQWRVAVTSRIDVDSATVLPVRPLSAGGSVSLTSTYARRTGLDLRSEDLTRIAEACDRNPLGIRLTLDAVGAGVSLSDATQLTKKHVVEYSFRNLTDRLDDDAKRLLELMFVWDQPISRARACSILDEPSDRVAPALRRLSQTTLVARADTESEEYVLSSAVRHLLLLHPADSDARGQARRRVRELRSSALGITQLQAHRELSELDQRYLPSKLPPDLRVPVYEALELTVKEAAERGAVIAALDSIQQLLESYADALLHRTKGLLLLRLDDIERAKESLRVAASGSSPDWPSVRVLARQLRYDREYKEALDWGRKLFEQEWIERVDQSTAAEVVQGYLLPLIFLGDCERALEMTAQWQSEGELVATYGTLRVAALRNSVDFKYGRDMTFVDDRLSEAADVLDGVIDQFGYPGMVVVEGMKLARQIHFRAKRSTMPSSDHIAKLSGFIADHLITLCALHRSYSIDEPQVKEWIRDVAAWDDEANRLSVLPSVGSDDDDLKGPSGDGWTPLRVYHRPRSDFGNAPTFVFAQDGIGRQYFVHRTSFAGTSGEWEELDEGTALLALPTSEYAGDGAWPVTQCHVSPLPTA